MKSKYVVVREVDESEETMIVLVLKYYRKMKWKWRDEFQNNCTFQHEGELT